MSEERKQCDQPAVYRYTWPGKNEEVICREHAEKVNYLAEAMGFSLQLIPLTDTVQQARPCHQMVKVTDQ